MQAAYLQFKFEHRNIDISFSKFSKLRPMHVLPACKTARMQCLCEYCVNIKFKLHALHNKCHRVQMNGLVITHKHELSYFTLCSRDEEELYHRRNCVDKECDACGTRKVNEHFEPLVQNFNDDEMTWKCWQSDKYTKTKKDGTGEQEAKHTVMKEKTGTVTTFLQDTCVELYPFSKHLNAKWQATQFESVKSNPPKSWVIMCMDYGENYNCYFQDEAQSAHWSYQQATIHPIVAYYKCQDCDAPMHQSIVIVSDDTKHDYHAVQHFISITNEHLLEEGIQISKQIHFSDGSPCQYRSKLNFADASHGELDWVSH